ncbi:MAG: hypothetical protein EXR77_03825 [Myxococcales bacterium]|nr:hypothetical protein [Myxococcales bacterium]
MTMGWTAARLGAALVFMATSACFSPVHVRSARILAVGEHEIGIAMAGAQLKADTVKWYNGTSTDSIKEPSAQGKISGWPELAYHYGIIENLEAGLRLIGGSGLAEVDANYRLLKTPLGSMHLHLSTGVIFGTALADETGGKRALVPLMATIDFNENWGLTLAGHLGYRWVTPPPVDPNLAIANIDDLRWLVGSDGLTYGGGLSADWRNDDWIARLFFESSFWHGEIGAQNKVSTYDVTVMQGGFAVGFKFGKDAAALRKSHDDLDSLTAPPK